MAHKVNMIAGATGALKLSLLLVLGLHPGAAADDARQTGYRVDQTRAATGSPSPILSGWDISGAGGHLTNGWGGLQIVDDSDTNSVSLTRAFCRQTSGIATVEFRFNVTVKVNGLTWQLRDGDKLVVGLCTSGGDLCYVTSSGATNTLVSYSANTEVGVKVVADLDQRSADIYVDGIPRASGAAFAGDAHALDTIFIDTGATGTCTLFQRGVFVHGGYAVNERFLPQHEGNLPSDWSASPAAGSVQVVRNHEISPDPDCNSALLTDTNTASSVVIGKTFAQQAGRTEFEFKFALPEKQDGFQARLLGDGEIVATFLTQGGHLCYRDNLGSSVPVWSNYLSNVWYYVRCTVDPATGLADIAINDIPRASGVAVSATSHSYVDKVEFETSIPGTGRVWLDDILVYPFQDYPPDYVPAPVPVEHGTNLIGLQVCNLWREGAHLGWDWISSDINRSSILGFYDEGNPEVSDWEIKFMVDHGIDFVMPCWYRPAGGTGLGPMKEDGYARGLGALKRARYANALRYSVIIETANAPMRSLNDWQYTVVPFLVEHYFKDPRFLVIDNKPVVGFFGGLNGTGDEEAARKALRDACIQAGFAGVTTIGCTTSGDTGFEYTYTYAKRFTAESVTNHISSPSVNWDRRAWDLPYNSLGTWKSADDYKALLTAQADCLTNKTGLARTLWMLGNWNEFGEGHFIMPTEGLGYRYLDAIREVFGDASPHVDVFPTPGQKARINVLYPQPRIITHPVDQKAVLGQAATYDVTAVGVPPRNCQWRRNGVDIPGATNTSFTFGPALPGNDRSLFSVAVSNGIGQATSRPALLSVIEYSPLCRLPISFDAYDRSEPLTNFPVLVTLSPARISGFSFSQFSSPHGYDLRFTDASGTNELNYDIERWDPAAGEAWVWVQLPQLTNHTTIQAMWGDPALARTPFASVTNGATWDASYRAVLHMGEGSGAATADATANGNDGTLLNSPLWQQGPIGKALSFNGSNSYVLAGQENTSLSLTNNLTLSAWIRPTFFHTNAYYGLLNGILSRGSYSAATVNYALQARDATTVAFIERTGTEGLQFTPFTGPAYTSDWAHITMSLAGTTATLYVNGQSWGSQPVGPIGPQATDSLYLGGIIPNHPETLLEGGLDEVRIRSVAESSNRVWAGWMNQVSNTVFVTPGVLTKEIDQADANHNGLPDVWENFYFGGTNATDGRPWDDWDHDGMCNSNEYVAGTCPTNAASYLRVEKAIMDSSAGAFSLQWPSVVGRLYSIQTVTNLPAGFSAATCVATQTPATPSINTHTVHVDTAQSRFYRIIVEREQTP